MHCCGKKYGNEDCGVQTGKAPPLEGDDLISLRREGELSYGQSVQSSVVDCRGLSINSSSSCIVPEPNIVPMIASCW